MITFSLLTFFKIRTVTAGRQIDNMRLSRDRQLTTMTLFHVLSAVIFTTPYGIFNVYSLSANATETKHIARNQLISTVTVLLIFECFAVSYFLLAINLQ